MTFYPSGHLSMTEDICLCQRVRGGDTCLRHKVRGERFATGIRWVEARTTHILQSSYPAPDVNSAETGKTDPRRREDQNTLFSRHRLTNPQRGPEEAEVGRAAAPG